MMASKRLAQTDTFNKPANEKMSDALIIQNTGESPYKSEFTKEAILNRTYEYSKIDKIDRSNNGQFDACYKVEADDSFDDDPCNRETTKKFYNTKTSSRTASRIENISKPRGFNIRKVNNKRPAAQSGQNVLNLVPEITPDLNVKQDYKPNLTENKLVNSKHMLFKTFNRYMANPNNFLQKPNMADLVSLNANFVDSHMAIQLFRTGAMTGQKAILNT